MTSGAATTPGDRTLAAYWGPNKPAALAALLEKLQELTAGHFGGAFETYDIEQIHATLIGLESEAVDQTSTEVISSKRVFSRHALALNEIDSSVPVRPVAPLEEVWRVHTSILNERPIQLRFGGSASPHRYRAAFQVGRTSVIVVGWPLSPDGSGFDDAIWQCRRRIGATTGYVHKYALERDNDVYLVLGRLRSRPDDEAFEALENAGRELLLQREVVVTLDVGSTRLVEYSDHRLPPGSTLILFGD